MQTQVLETNLPMLHALKPGVVEELATAVEAALSYIQSRGISNNLLAGAHHGMKAHRELVGGWPSMVRWAASHVRYYLDGGDTGRLLRMAIEQRMIAFDDAE